MTANGPAIRVSSWSSAELFAALDDLSAAIEESLPKPLGKTAQSFFDSPDLADKLVRIETNCSATVAGDLSVALYPTDLLRMLPAAFRAGKVDDLLVEQGHINSPHG